MDIIKFTFKILKPFTKKIVYKKKYLNLLNMAVKTKKYDLNENLENLELVGDKELQNYLSKYFYKKFCKSNYTIKNGNIVHTRLNIKYLSTFWLSKICQDIGLDNFIRKSTMENFDNTADQIREDVFEAWCGACLKIFKKKIFERFLSIHFDNFKINLNFENLFDVKSRLNDFTSIVGSKTINIGTWNFIENETLLYKNILSSSKHSWLESIGIGETKKIAENNAAENLLAMLKTYYGDDFEKYYSKTNSFKQWKEFSDDLKNKIKQ